MARWQVEQVFALAPKPSSLAAAQPLAVPSRWVGAGCNERAVWGRCTGGSAEPYVCAVDHVAVAVRCSCPSRVLPCKHALALLLLWARGQVAEGEAPAFAAGVVASVVAKAPKQAAEVPEVVTVPVPVPSAHDGGGDAGPITPPIFPDRDPNTSRDDRLARMAAGLAELDRWLDDRVRTGLADPALARYSTWDDLAARLIDAQVGGLANRVRRLAGVVGAHPDWHQQVLSELGRNHADEPVVERSGQLPQHQGGP